MNSSSPKTKPADRDFARGYFCAVAVYLKESCQEGSADTMAKSLFGQGGDWTGADPEDIETFRIHRLVPAGRVCDDVKEHPTEGADG